MRGEKDASLRQEKERSITHTGTGASEDLTHLIGVACRGDTTSEACLKLRQGGFWSWQRLGVPRAEWKSRGSEEKQTRALR